MVQLKGTGRLNSIWALKCMNEIISTKVKTTYTQEGDVLGIEMTPNTRAFFKANAGDSLFCADVDVHKPMFNIFFHVGVVVDWSESEDGIVGRFHWTTAVLRAPTRIVRALTRVKYL